MKTTFPLSQLTAEALEVHNKYANTPFVTYVKPVLPDFQRTAISFFNEMDKMIADGWLVIDATK